MYFDLAIMALFLFVYSSVARGVERSTITGPIVFTLFGLAAGPFGVDLLHLSVQWEDMRLLAELALALVLFTDAAGADLVVLRGSVRIPQRLLLIGLPLTIVAGTLAALLLFPGLALIEAALLATILAPTDAALGKAVVTNRRVPASIRESLNVESGLNDGICVPILFIFLALAADVSQLGGPWLLALRLVVEEIGIGLAVGGGLVLLGGNLLWLAQRRGWIDRAWRPTPVVALSLGCFALAQALGGSGFIAAFSGGLLFGWLCGPIKRDLLLDAEGAGNSLALLTWVIFGAAIVGYGAGELTWQAVAYALLSLTVVRMVPVVLSLTGLGLDWGSKLFLGWFGPRGLASIVFIVIVTHETLPGNPTLSITVVMTIGLSILLHGLSAKPLVRWIAARPGRGAVQLSR